MEKYSYYVTLNGVKHIFAQNDRKSAERFAAENKRKAFFKYDMNISMMRNIVIH